MTDPVIEYGSGRLAFRLQISGMPYEAVTDKILEDPNDYDTTFRILGLQHEGIVLEEHVDMARARIDVSPMTVQLVDVMGATEDGEVETPWTALFSKRPTARTWLDITCDEDDTTLTVRSTTGFASAGYLYIDQECIHYTGITATTFTGCTRGERTTIPTSHYAFDTTGTRAAEITDWPLTMEGRHCWLHYYGQPDIAAGDNNGHQMWVGIISRDARLVDGTTWELGIDPVTRIFGEPIGGDLGQELRPRGVYYPANACFGMDIYVSSDSTAANLPAAPTDTIQVTGFYETNDAVANAINTQIAAGPAATYGLKCVAEANDRIHFELVTPGAGARFVAIWGGSPCDNIHYNYYARSVVPLLSPGTLEPDTATVTSVSTTQTYIYSQTGPALGSARATGTSDDGITSRDHVNALAAPGSVPRGVWIGSAGDLPYDSAWQYLFRKPADDATYPLTRVYLDGFSSLAGVTDVVVDRSDGTTMTGSIDDYDDTARWINLGQTNPHGASVSFAGGGYPVVTPSRLYADGESMLGLRTGLLGAVQAGAPVGTAPYIFSSSFTSSLPALTSDFGAWAAVESATAGHSLAARTWLFSRAQKLGDILQEEAKNIGCFFALNTSGQIEVYQLGIAPTGVSWTIDGTTELTDVAPSQWERNAKGSVVEVLIKTGYDPIQDEFTGRSYKYHDVSGFGRNPSAQTIEIAPKSQWFGVGGDPTIQTYYAAITSSLFSIFGYGYNIITIDVPFTFFTAVCGDSVVITSKNLPSGDGDRGMSLRAGVIIGRRIDFAQSAITLEILSSEVNYAGYTPTSRISSSSHLGSFVYDLTIAAPAGSGATRAYSDGTAWKADDAIRVVVWDSTTSTTQTGTVVSDGTTTTVQVQLDGAIPGAGTLNLEYDVASAGWTANQQAYTPAAPATDVVDLGGGDTEPAKQFI